MIALQKLKCKLRVVRPIRRRHHLLMGLSHYYSYMILHSTYEAPVLYDHTRILAYRTTVSTSIYGWCTHEKHTGRAAALCEQALGKYGHLFAVDDAD